MNSERRKARRYKISHTDLMVFRRSSHFAGWIKDISLNGLSFESISNIDYNSELPEIGIFAYRYDRFCLADLPIKICYNKSAAREEYSFSCIPTRVCGVVFDEMSDKHQARITHLLNTYITDKE